MLVESRSRSGDQDSVSAILFDAYEGRVYADHHFVADKVKYWKWIPLQCTLIPSFTAKRDCTTIEEFDEFVTPYLEE